MSAESALEDAKRLTHLLYNVLAVEVAPESIADDEEGVLGGLYFKLLAHAASAIAIAERPTPVPGTKLSFTDVASVYTLARNAYEAALVLHFVFLVPESKVSAEQRKLRLLRWKLGGFLEGKEWKPLRREHQERKAEYAEEAERLRDQIKQLPAFQALPDRWKKGMGRVATKDKVLKGHSWKEEHWHELAAEMDIIQGHFKPTYSHLCAYAHSGAVSAGQLWNMNTMPDKENVRRALARTALQLLVVPLALTILAYAERFPEAKAALHKDAKDLAFVTERAGFRTVDFTKSDRATSD